MRRRASRGGGREETGGMGFVSVLTDTPSAISIFISEQRFKGFFFLFFIIKFFLTDVTLISKQSWD